MTEYCSLGFSRRSLSEVVAIRVGVGVGVGVLGVELLMEELFGTGEPHEARRGPIVTQIERKTIRGIWRLEIIVTPSARSCWAAAHRVCPHYSFLNLDTKDNIHSPVNFQ
jgi:hypothetical protein